MSFKLVGVNKVIKNLEKLNKRLNKEGVVAIREEAELAVERAKALAPVDTGRLRDSIRVERVRETRTGVQAELRAGGEDAPYAARVHEEHPSHSKFLQKAVLRIEPSRIAERLRRALRGRLR